MNKNIILNNLDTIAQSLKEAMQKVRLSDAEKRKLETEAFLLQRPERWRFQGIRIKKDDKA